MGAEWFYVKDRQKLGPVNEQALRSFLQTGELSASDLVWTEAFGTDWKPISMTDLAARVPGPPPLPTTHIVNNYAWAIALVPIVGAFVEMVIEQRVALPLMPVLVAYMAIYIGLVFLDLKEIRATGNTPDTSAFQNWWFFVPVYLFKRAKALKQPKHYFWTWIGAFVAATVISGEAASLFDKNTYWGAGLPPCDSNYTKKTTQEIFRDIPLMKARGIVAIDVKNAKQISGDSKHKKCTATFVTSAGTELVGTYTISMQENDNFYTTLEFN